MNRFQDYSKVSDMNTLVVVVEVVVVYSSIILSAMYFCNENWKHLNRMHNNGFMPNQCMVLSFII